MYLEHDNILSKIQLKRLPTVDLVVRNSNTLHTITEMENVPVFCPAVSKSSLRRKHLAAATVCSDLEKQKGAIKTSRWLHAKCGGQNG